MCGKSVDDPCHADIESPGERFFVYNEALCDSLRELFRGFKHLADRVPSNEEIGIIVAKHAEAYASSRDAIIKQLRGERDAANKELEALQAGARTGMLKYMMAGDVGCFVDKMNQLLQAEDWDGMRLTVRDFFAYSHDETGKRLEEIRQTSKELEAAEASLVAMTKERDLSADLHAARTEQYDALMKSHKNLQTQLADAKKDAEDWKRVALLNRRF